MSFEWDDKKASANLKKYGVSFAEAATAFQDPNALEMFDEINLKMMKTDGSLLECQPNQEYCWLFLLKK